MEHIGKYKGYNVYKTPKSEMSNDQERGNLYAVAETGELVLNGEVVGKVAFSSGSVTEYDDHKCYRYKYPTRREYTYADEKPVRGKRAETVSVDEVCRSTVVDPTPLDEMINEFIIAARKMTIEDYTGVFNVEQ